MNVINIHIVEGIIMKIKKLVLFILLISILTCSIGSISATDSINNDTITKDNDRITLEHTDDNLIDSSEDVILEDSTKTINVPFDPRNPNEVLLPKIQPAIDGANPGDTIVIQGSPVHCHLTINKKLNIISGGDSTTIDPCPHHTHEGLDEYGVFYIPKEGSGSTIQGFTFINKDKSKNPFSILIDGAKDITIKDCVMADTTPSVDKYVGIIIRNSNNVKLSNLIVSNTINGITIINSTNIEITNCNFTDNQNHAILVSENSKNINIHDNYIINNGNCGINLTSADYININNNLIKNNGLKNDDSGSGIYVNTNIVKLTVKGNIFLSNALHAIMYDYRTRNLNLDEGADQLTIVDDNYFEGHTSMVLHHRTYVQKAGGTMVYDAENDVFIKSSSGNYVEGKSYVFMQNAFIYNDVPCGFTYYTTTIPWTLDAPANNGRYNLSLKLSEINEIKNGAYQIGIIDSKGQVASDFNLGYIIFFLNDYSTVEPKTGNVYKIAYIKNGVATADFRDVYDSFKTSNNIITAVFPGLSENVNRNPYKQCTVDDSNIPTYEDSLQYLTDLNNDFSVKLNSKLSASTLTTYPLSDAYLSVKLVDSNNNAISGQTITFKFNQKTYTAKTDNKGIAKVKVSLASKKTYPVTITFTGNDKYISSKITSKIIIKVGSKKSKIKSSNIKIKRNKKKTFKLKLTSGNGKALNGQILKVKVNGKQYTIKTNKNGIAKISLKFKKAKKYKLKMSFLGNSKFKAVSKTNTVTVTKK